MITKGLDSPASNSLRMAIKWLYFCTYYPKRKKNENGSRYYKKRKLEFIKSYVI